MMGDALRSGPGNTWLLLSVRQKDFRAGEQRRNMMLTFQRDHSGCPGEKGPQKSRGVTRRLVRESRQR